MFCSIFLYPSGNDYFPEVQATPPPDFVYEPIYCHYFYPNLAGNQERNLGIIAEVVFNKLHPHTFLRMTWEGNFRKKSCSNCCARWFITIDGSPCSNYEDIETSIASASALDIFAPTTLTGVCNASGEPIYHDISMTSASLTMTSLLHRPIVHNDNCTKTLLFDHEAEARRIMTSSCQVTCLSRRARGRFAWRSATARAPASPTRPQASTPPLASSLRRSHCVSPSETVCCLTPCVC